MSNNYDVQFVYSTVPVIVKALSSLKKLMNSNGTVSYNDTKFIKPISELFSNLA